MLLAILSHLPALAFAGLAAYIFRRYDRVRRAAESGADVQRLRDEQAEAVRQVAQTQQRALEQVVRRMQQLEQTQTAHAEAIDQLTAQVAHHRTALEQLGQVVQQGFTRLDAVAETLRGSQAAAVRETASPPPNEHAWELADPGN